MNTIQELWESYQRVGVPENASAAQIMATKSAFYAGAASSLKIMADIAENVASEAAGAGVLAGLYSECQMFANSMGKL